MQGNLETNAMLGLGSNMSQKWVLLYADSVEHPNDNKRHQDEIRFEKPVVIDQIRIVRKDIQVHQLFKQLRSKTQSESIKELQIFYKDLKRPESRFKVLMNEGQVNEQ